MQRISIKKSLVLALFEIIEKTKRSASRITQQDVGYFRLMIDLASLGTPENKKRFKHSPLNKM